MSYLLKSRDDLRKAANGFFAEDFPIHFASTATVVVNQTLYFALVGLRRGDVVTNIHYCVGTAGSAGTTVNSYVGIYDTAGALKAYSADLGTLNNTPTGIKTATLTGGSGAYTVLADGAYYLAFLESRVGGSPVWPALSRGVGSPLTVAPAGSGVRGFAVHNATVSAALSTITTATFADIPSNGYTHWMAVS